MSKFIVDQHGNQIFYDLESPIYSIDTWYGYIFINDKRLYIRPHRENGPAIIKTNGTEYYCLQGKLHREDGPALLYNSLNKYSWYLNGWEISFDGWCKKLNKSDEEINFLKLKYICK